jgi:hypothetical protein
MKTNRTGAQIWPTIAALLLATSVPAGHAHAQVKVLEYQGKTSQQLGVTGRAGDVDQDGCDDFICAAPFGDTDNDANMGEAFVYSGRKGGLLYAFRADVPGYSGFGQAVAGDGDFDGDGFVDLLIGSWRDYLGNGAGSVSIYSGRTGVPLLRQYGISNGDAFGWSVDFIGDLDGDGCDEFIVGALTASTASVYHGATGRPFFTLTGQSATSWFGSSVSRLGDVNGDAVPDFIVGEPKFSAWWLLTSENGRAVVYSGATAAALWEADGSRNFDWMGLSTGDVGDVDGDGRNDVILGAPHVFGTGAAYVLSGGTGGWLLPLFGDGQGDLFGWSVSGLRGDISGDGVPDFIVGAPGYDPSDGTSLQNGYARTFSGSDGTLFDTYEANTQPGDRNYGLSVCGGDFNGDGYGDWAIGFPDWNRNSTQNGKVEVYAGCAASWKYYGIGWPGAVTVPVITPSGDISPGHTVTLSLSNSGAGDTFGFLFIGLKPAYIPTNVDGVLLVSPFQTMSISIPFAGLTMTGSIPNDPKLLCTDVYLQAIEADAMATKGFSFTPGTKLHIGLIYP